MTGNKIQKQSQKQNSVSLIPNLVLFPLFSDCREYYCHSCSHHCSRSSEQGCERSLRHELNWGLVLPHLPPCAFPACSSEIGEGGWWVTSQIEGPTLTLWCSEPQWLFHLYIPKAGSKMAQLKTFEFPSPWLLCRRFPPTYEASGQ